MIMRTIAQIILTKILGWKIKGEFPDINKSIVIFAPHTSYYDGLYGKLYLMTTGVEYKFLSKKEFFKFPYKYFFRLYGSIPVFENSKYINDIVQLMDSKDKLHIVISPEGQLAITDRWKKGFYYMAVNAKVPIVMTYLDFQKKEIGVKGIIDETKSFKNTMEQINYYYKDVVAKYPEQFSLDKRFN